MTRAVVNVGTGRYKDATERLRTSVSQHDTDARFYSWDEIPEDWPTHKQKPYAFKAYALELASNVADVLLWCDSAIVVVKPLAPLWERIERDGYWIPLNGWTNYDWTADSAYPDLFPNVPIEEARAQSKTFSQVVATAFGVNVKHPTGKSLLGEYVRLAKMNAFCGPWSNTNNPKHWPLHPDMMGPCGPADVLGHRHDQTALSVIAWRLGLKLEQCPGFFSYAPGNENTVLMSVGA